LFPFFVVGGYDIRARFGLVRRRDVRAEADGHLLWAWGIGAPCFFGFFLVAEVGRLLGELYHGEPRSEHLFLDHEERQLQRRNLYPRRAAKKVKGNTFLSAKGREELQLQHLLSAEDAEGRGELQLQRQNLFPRRTRRTATATSEPLSTKGR